MSECRHIEGGITAPMGFKASAVEAGIKSKRTDMALLVSDPPAVAAGVFTTNKIQAAPVKLCKAHLASSGTAAAVVINSGYANACTGARGMQDAVRMAHLVAENLKVDAETVYVCSTGTIGIPLPMDKIEAGIRRAATTLSDDSGDAAARAIMTTDTVSKQVAMEIDLNGTTVRIGGMAKGSGMIEPNMATMLAFLTTDAAVDSTALQCCLSQAVEQSFNRITVDGDQSTNDTVLFFANGAAGNDVLHEDHPDWDVFVAAVNDLTRNLALQIVRDGEGATKLVAVTVSGAASNEDAYRAARAVANSLLVKTSWFGCDPNWGRVVDAVGYSGAEVKEELIDVRYDSRYAVRHGEVAPDMALKELEAILVKDSFSLHIELHLGDGTDTVYTCDCSEEYVRINSEYMT